MLHERTECRISGFDDQPWNGTSVRVMTVHAEGWQEAAGIAIRAYAQTRRRPASTSGQWLSQMSRCPSPEKITSSEPMICSAYQRT